MLPTRFDPSCATPGGQVLLFLIPADKGRPTYTVTDLDGYERVETSALGVAMSVTRHLVLTQGAAYVCSSDATVARVARSGIDTNGPDRPWIRTLANHMEAIA